MDVLGKPAFLADEEMGKAPPSNPNFHPLHRCEVPPKIASPYSQFVNVATPPVVPSWEELLELNSVGSSTMKELNRQQSGHLGGTSSDVERERAWRKRQNDRKYRERLKEGKLAMKCNMDLLYVENENLKQENERLQREHDSMNGILQDQAKLIDQLKNDLDKLNDEYKKQNVLVQRLSELLASPDLQLENERLKLENGQLRRNVSLDYNFVLAQENVKLQLENKVLKVQNDALCGKLISDGDKKHT